MTDHDAIAAKVRQDRETGTPGPWHHETDDHRWIDYTDPRSGTCWNVTYVHSHCGYPIDGSSANASRIAALPDLEAAYLDLYDKVQRLRAVLDEIATGLSGIARDIQIGPDDEGRDIYEMVLAIRDDARAALKGVSNE